VAKLICCWYWLCVCVCRDVCTFVCNRVCLLGTLRANSCLCCRDDCTFVCIMFVCWEHYGQTVASVVVMIVPLFVSCLFVGNITGKQLPLLSWWLYLCLYWCLFVRNITGKQLPLLSWNLQHILAVDRGSCIKFARWQHPAVGRGVRFDSLASLVYGLLTLLEKAATDLNKT